MSALSQFRAFHGPALPPGGLRLKPHTVEDVRAIVQVARRHRVPVIPRGGGSGVVLGVFPDPRSIVLDLTALAHIGPLDAVTGEIKAEAGVNLKTLETHLAEQGHTLGHWPQSIDWASVGGLVATKSIGQYSTRYGGIENMVSGLDVVLGTGETLVLGSQAPRRSEGPEALSLFIGSEGTLGVITAVRLKVWPAPEAEGSLSLIAPDFTAGAAIVRRWMKAGLTPSVVRLYDEAESGRTFSSVRGQCVLIAVFHGPQALVDAFRDEAGRLSKPEGSLGGDDLAAKWFAVRNDVAVWVPLLQQGFLVDTIEVSASWSTLSALHQDVIEALGRIDGVLGVTGHTSHAYLTGANLYFTVMARPDPPEAAAALYDRIWNAVMELTLARHGAVSHHHRVGRNRPSRMSTERRESRERTPGS